MKPILKKLFKTYMEATKTNTLWLTTGCTYVPWRTGKE